MNKFPVPLEGQSPNGAGDMAVVAFATTDGVPKVVLMIRTDVASTYEAKLDGHPALAIFLSEDQRGTGNAPWELGHLLAHQWEEAKKLAEKKR